MSNTTVETPVKVVITPEELLQHWQGHRGLTRRVIEAFPEKEFFEYSIGGMRTFSKITLELLSMAGPTVRQITLGEKSEYPLQFDHGNKKEAFLKLWDETTETMNQLWPQITADRFHDEFILFGQWKGTVLSTIQYNIDNEIHHRGQGYVYLRSLGIEPPAFWER